MPPWWTVPSTIEVEEIPLPTLEEVNFGVLKLKNYNFRTKWTECRTFKSR
jgi:hypothetical protein